MTRYAQDTEVGSDRSRAEIERTLIRYGASAFAYGWDRGRGAATVAFEKDRRHIRFILPMPDRNSREFTHTPARKTRRSDAEVEKAYEQAVRQRWRALALVIKAKLEAVESGITTFEDEFLAHTVIAGNATVSEWVQPQIQQAIESGNTPTLVAVPGSQPAIEMGR